MIRSASSAHDTASQEMRPICAVGNHGRRRHALKPGGDRMSKTVVDVWVADLTFPGYMDRWRKLGEEFNAKHPDYHVNVEGKDFRLFPVDIANAAAEGKPPAVAEYYFYLVHQARDSIKPDCSPLFTSIEQAVAGRDEILGEPNVLPDLIAAGREYYSLNGDLTAIPSVGTTSLLYANL